MAKEDSKKKEIDEVQEDKEILELLEQRKALISALKKLADVSTNDKKKN